MTLQSSHQHFSGEDIAPNDLQAPATTAAPIGETAPADPIDRIRLQTALGEIDSLKLEIADREQTINDLRARIGHRRGGTMSPASDDRSRQAQRLDDIATHAVATGKRRDLLSYLRLRRKRNV